MPIYKVIPHHDCMWGHVNEVIVRAKDKNQAKQLAVVECGREGEEAYENASIEEVEIDGESGIICIDFSEP